MRPLLFALTCALLAAPVVAAAESPQDKGLRIAKEIDAFNSGYKGETTAMEMVLINAHGDKVSRKLRGRVLEMTDDGDRSISIFEWPADVKGTRMLTWTHKTKVDDQWLYLPSLKRTKRISSRNQSGSFMGSEFAYEDFGSQEVEKYTYTWLRDEAVDGRKVWVIERVPTNKRSGYSKQVVWMDQEYRSPLKIDYYDRKGEQLKTMTFSKYEKFDRWWRPGQIDVHNHQTHKKSVLTWTERKVGVAHDPEDFEKEALED